MKGTKQRQKDELNVNLATLLSATASTARPPSKQPQELLPEADSSSFDVSLGPAREVGEVGFDGRLKEENFGLEEVEFVEEEHVVGVPKVY